MFFGGVLGNSHWYHLGVCLFDGALFGMLQREARRQTTRLPVSRISMRSHLGNKYFEVASVAFPSGQDRVPAARPKLDKSPEVEAPFGNISICKGPRIGDPFVCNFSPLKLWASPEIGSPGEGSDSGFPAVPPHPLFNSRVLRIRESVNIALAVRPSVNLCQTYSPIQIVSIVIVSTVPFGFRLGHKTTRNTTWVCGFSIRTPNPPPPPPRPPFCRAIEGGSCTSWSRRSQRSQAETPRRPQNGWLSSWFSLETATKRGLQLSNKCHTETQTNPVGVVPFVISIWRRWAPVLPKL